MFVYRASKEQISWKFLFSSKAGLWTNMPTGESGQWQLLRKKGVISPQCLKQGKKREGEMETYPLFLETVWDS